MASKVDIANLALIRLGADLINSLEQPNNKNAKIMNQAYDLVRKELLRAHPWNFAVRRATLASSTDSPEFGYSYKCPLPSDCLRVLRADNPYLMYKIEGDFLLSDDSSVAIYYVSNVTDTGAFDSLFQEALILKLAATVGSALTDSLDKVRMMQDLFERVIRQAKQVDGQEDSAPVILSDVWVLAGD